MLTPQEVAEHAFSKASFGGYNMTMVDEFLDLVTADYTTLYKENAALKAKMKLLADKIEEYRATEDAMRRALLSAQNMADQIVTEAKEKADKMVDEAEANAKEKAASLHQEVENEQLRLTAAQNATAAYVAKLKELYQNEMLYISGLSRLSAAPKADPVETAAQDIGAAVEKAVEEELPPEVDEITQPLPQAEQSQEGPNLYEELRQNTADQAKDDEEDDDEDEDASPTRRINFDHLKFGKDYEID
jgi:cell division initiation protein